MASSDVTAYDTATDWERTARVVQPAIATLFLLSSLRLLTAQIALTLYPRWGLAGALVPGLCIVAMPFVAIALRRYCTHPIVISALPLAMGLARVMGQIIDRPDANWICATLTLMLYGLFLPLYAGWLASRERAGIYALAWGMAGALPLDLCVRALLASSDPFFSRGLLALAIVLVLAAILASRTITWPRRTVREALSPIGRGGWTDGLIMAGLGSTLFLGYALYLNAASAGPLANAAYPGAIVTSLGIGLLALIALYYDADNVQFLDQSPRATAIITNVVLLIATGILVFYRLSHWDLPLLAIGLGALAINLVLFTRLLASTAGHPTVVLGFGLGLGLGLIIGLAVPLALDVDWVPAVAAGVTLLTGIAAGLLLRTRKSPARVVRAVPYLWVASALLLALVAGVLFIQPGGTLAEPGDTVTLLTFNMRSGYGPDGAFDLNRTVRAIRQADADIVALQEVNRGVAANGFTDDIVALVAALRPAGYRYWTFGAAHDPLFGNAIISRFPIVADTNFPYQTPADSDRAVLAARVRIGGRRLAVYSTQLADAQAADRASQVQELIGLAAGEGLPKVLVGDFNAPPDAPELQPLTGQYVDAYVQGHGSAPAETYPASAPKQRLDYVFVSEGVVAQRADVLQDVPASDHLPVSVTVQILR